jgi:tetratricopeptide (TPR) repeat protein
MRAIKRWMGIGTLIAAGATRAAGQNDAAEAARQAGEAGRRAGEQAREAARAAQEQVREATRNIRVNVNMGGDEYRSGQSAIDRRDYETAIKRFDRVIFDKSTRADGAMYWKDYSLYKLGRRPEATTVLADLEKQFPQSRWLNDARALAAEVRASNGQPNSPESESDEELKLLAMNSLMQQDPDRAIPLVEKVLADAKSSPSLKGRAVFVLAQSRSPKARQIVIQYAKGGTNPDAQMRAIEYLGTFRSDESSQALSEVYAATTDPMVKRTVIRGLMVARAKDRLVQIARTDSDVNMRREALQYLTGMQAETELAAMYKTETNKELKMTIIHSLMGQGGAKQLVDLAKTETDPELKRAIVRDLTNIKSKDAEDYLEDLIKK